MKNYIQGATEIRTFTAPTGGVVAGTPLRIGQYVIIPAVTAAAGTLFDGAISGRFTVPKVSAQAWTVGQLVYWDSATSTFTNTGGTGDTLVGRAGAIAANPTATGVVDFDGAARANL
jgi:predicted RecA/RadA family phage recombinase